MDIEQIQAAVEQSFAVTGAGTPGWADPHAEDREPRQEEYSRCTEPGKYYIVHARADAWVAALESLGLGAARSVPVAGLWRDGASWGSRPATRAVLVEPARTDALPVVFAYWDGTEEWTPSVQVGCGMPATVAAGVPDCGCDACDSGSAGLLVELDEAVAPLLTGDWLHVTAPRVTAWETSPGTGGASGDLDRVDHRALLAEARAGRSPHRVLRAVRWW